MVKILELFGGIGAPRKALQNLGVPVKSIDYVEIDHKAVASYNAMFDNNYQTQDVIGWNLKPDILVHGSPCQDFSIAGHQLGGDPNSCTRSSLMWETVNIIKNMGTWRPRIVVWENVKNVISRHMIGNFNAYLQAMSELGYNNVFDVLDARDFGLPQARERVFTISTLGVKFDYLRLEHRQMRPLCDYIQKDVDEAYRVTQPSVLGAIGCKGVRRTTVIDKYAYTITTRPDRTPAQVIKTDTGYRYLTERECWRLQGFSDEDFNAALAAHPSRGKLNRVLYKQAGNSMPVDVLEAIFKVVL